MNYIIVINKFTSDVIVVTELKLFRDILKKKTTKTGRVQSYRSKRVPGHKSKPKVDI